MLQNRRFGPVAIAVLAVASALTLACGGGATPGPSSGAVSFVVQSRYEPVLVPEPSPWPGVTRTAVCALFRAERDGLVERCLIFYAGSRIALAELDPFTRAGNAAVAGCAGRLREGESLPLCWLEGWPEEAPPAGARIDEDFHVLGVQPTHWPDAGRTSLCWRYTTSAGEPSERCNVSYWGTGLDPTTRDLVRRQSECRGRPGEPVPDCHFQDNWPPAAD